MEHFSWEYQDRDGVAGFDPIQGLDSEVVYDLTFGKSVVSRFSSDAAFHMSAKWRRDVKLCDQPHETHGMKLASPALQALLRAEQPEGIEYLPVTLYDHKGKVASTEYCVVNPIRIVDCIDQDASEFNWNNLAPDRMSEVSLLVLDDARLDPELKIFRPRHKEAAILIREDLAEVIEASGLVGPYMLELSEFSG